MKKGFKIAGAIAGLAAAAALIPYSVRSDEEENTTTVRALLWKYTSRPDPEDPQHRQVLVEIGRQRPGQAQDDPAEPVDLDMAGVDVPAGGAPQCDIELTLEPKLDDGEPAAPENLA